VSDLRVLFFFPCTIHACTCGLHPVASSYTSYTTLFYAPAAPHLDSFYYSTMDHPAPIEEQPLEALQTQRAQDLAIQQAIDEVLEYHRTHRPKNTSKNYVPKQREWKASILFSS